MAHIIIQRPIPHALAEYQNHLEFAGYTIEEAGAEWISACHPRKVDLGIVKIADRGVLVYTIYPVKENLRRTSFLEFMNTLNIEFIFMKAYINDTGSIRIDTFFEGDYNKTNFSILLENINFDMNIFFNHELTGVYVK